MLLANIVIQPHLGIMFFYTFVSNIYLMKAKNCLTWIKRLKIGNYLRELSVVIIGVAITLYASGVVSSIKEKKDLKLQLNAIYTELEENSRRLDAIIEDHKQHELLRNYLHRVIKDPAIYNNDSIAKYDKTLSSTATFSYKKGAFDMFVNSGAMALLTDREQLLEITECYALLEEFKDENDKFYEIKSQMFSETYRVDKKKFFSEDYDLRDEEWNIKFNFHTLNSGMVDFAVSVKEQLEVALSK